MSVMENHHTALTFAILAKRDCAILSHLDKPMRQVRSLQSHPSCMPITADLTKLQDPVRCSQHEDCAAVFVTVECQADLQLPASALLTYLLDC